MNDLKLYTDLDDADLQSLTDREFEYAEFNGIDFSLRSPRSTSFLECRFTNCSFANQPLLNCSFKDVVFETCNLVGINWCSVKRLETITFNGSKLSFSSFQGLKLKHLKMTSCLALDVDFSGADLSMADFANSTFTGASFERSNLSSADFSQSRDYLFDLRTARIKGAKFSYPEVLSLITALGAKIQD